MNIYTVDRLDKFDYDFIEDIKCKLEEMEDYTATNEDLKSIAYKAQKTLDNNDSYWDSYWCTLENVIEDYFRDA